MCVVSAVMDYGRTIPIPEWTVPKYGHFKELVDAAKRFDHAALQPHCEDPEKIKLLERIEAHLASLAERVGKIEDRLSEEVETEHD